MFRPYLWAIIRLRLDFWFGGYTSTRVVVFGFSGAGSRPHYITGHHGPYGKKR